MTRQVERLALSRNLTKCPIGGGLRISGCRLRSTVLPSRPRTGGPPNGLQELISFPDKRWIPDFQNQLPIPLELYHSMKVDRLFSLATAIRQEFDARRLAQVPGRGGSTPVPERAREKSAWQVPPLRVGPVGSQRGVESRRTLPALAAGNPAAYSRPKTREQPFTETQ